MAQSNINPDNIKITFSIFHYTHFISDTYQKNENSNHARCEDPYPRFETRAGDEHG